MPYPEEITSPIDVVGIKLDTPADFQKCVRFYVDRHPGGYLSSIGHNTVIIPRKFLPRLIDDLQTQKVHHEEFAVRSMADLSPEEAADLRTRRGQPATPEYQDRRKVLEKLRESYGIS
jgi:hypothetical protein